MPETDRLERVARFEGFEFDLRSGELRRNGDPAVRLASQPFGILLLLLQHPCEVVLREEIRRKLWPNDTVVEFEHSISAAMNRLRQALGESGDSPHYIETLPGRGYRWMVPVEWIEPTAAVSAQPPAPAIPQQPTPETLIGQKVSHYRILELLGGGGMGVVYRAEDVRLGRAVAIKFLGEELSDDQRAQERFEREARAISALDHPNICTIYEVDEHEGQPFIVMQLLQGQTLRQRIESAAPGQFAFSRRELLDVAIQIVAGLNAAHQKGIIHRDIKPANIFLTHRGEVKLLDFGLAKLMDIGGNPGKPTSVKPPAPERQDLAIANDRFDLGLTLTGATLGTASYMSPEQVRKEPVDARSDLFSFGAVLYEMVTGRQAFWGETPDAIHDAILNYTPPSPLALNTDLPDELDSIIARALEKDREKRYQSASEISADLQRLKLKESGLASGTELEGFAPAARTASARLPVSSFHMLWLLAIVVSASALLFWQWRVSHRPSVPREPKANQLTANSFENPVTSSAISPDGKYLAFTDSETKMRVRLLATGETQTIPEPESLHGIAVAWTVVAWLPDGTRFVANARAPDNLTTFPDRHRFLFYKRPDGPSETPGSRPVSTWIVSVIGNSAQKLRDDAFAYSVSPDGGWIAFGSSPGQFGDREIWLMDPRGQQAHKLFDAQANTALGGFSWSRDGQRAVYFRFGAADGALLSRSVKGGPAIPLVRIPDWTTLNDFVWLPDGRLLYANGCNFWELGIDPQSAQPNGPPRQVTNWTEYCVGGISTTSDGARLAFQRWARLTTVHVADLEANGRQISSVRHLTLNEYVNAAETWTPDSKALVYRSTRDGHLRLFKQALDSETEEPLVVGRENVSRSSFSPDGAWLFYMDCGPQAEALCEGVVPVMAIPTGGGSPHQVLASDTYLQPSCPLAPGRFCIVAEQSEEGKPLIFIGFDAVHGRGPELARFPTEPGVQYNWALSADGNRLAIFRVWDSRVHIISLTGQVPQTVVVKPDARLVLMSWAPDGKGWFTATKDRSSVVLLHVDLKGVARPLWELKGGIFAYGLPSPDGRHLAIVAVSRTDNVWMMGNF